MKDLFYEMSFIMRKLLDIGNRYAKESTWKDFAIVKFCLFAMGLAAGTQVPAKYRKAAAGVLQFIFARFAAYAIN